MSRIALLIAETDELTDGNYLRFAPALGAAGHDIWLCPMDSLALAGNRVVARAHQVTGALKAGAPMPGFAPTALDDMDAIWVLSLGMRHSFLDKMQLLFNLSQQVRVINSVDAIMHLKSKYFLASQPEVFRHPPTWAGTDPAMLYDIMTREGGKFVAKPPAASFGRDVYVLTPDTPNVHVILQSLCGPDEDRYCLLQRYVDEIGAGEKRVLIAGGEPVGQYLRKAGRDHRTNVHQGASVSACELSAEEREYCRRIGQFLHAFGAEYVGLDLAYPWVIEFNVVNPGGVATIESLTGVDITPEILARLGLA